MLDGHGRLIEYVRVSVTDRCNFRCVYCMPPEGVDWIPNAEIVTDDEIVLGVSALARLGLWKVRLTGGEPLIRPGMPRLVERIAAIPGVREIALTTNGTKLAEQAEDLALAGLTRVNVSLDTLRPERLMKISYRSGLERVLAGIEAAERAGLAPLKINSVVMRGYNDDEAEALAALSISRGWTVRFIEEMPLLSQAGAQARSYVSAEELKVRFKDYGARIGRPFEFVDNPFAGGGPARYGRFAGAPGRIGFITPLSDNFCESCNRVRLTARGFLRHCLFGTEGVDLRPLLRRRASADDVAALVAKTIARKPEKHGLGVGLIAVEDLYGMTQVGG